MCLEATTRHLNEYGEAGLRTLALAYRKLDDQEYSDWNNEFQKAKTAVGSEREAMLEQVSDIMERELILVGATAVEELYQLKSIVIEDGALLSLEKLELNFIGNLTEVPRGIDKLRKLKVFHCFGMSDEFKESFNLNRGQRRQWIIE